MNFNAPLLRPFRILLFPFSLIYGAAVWVRNRLFDKGIFRSVSFNLPVICIGNLSAGGTGKSPMVEFLVRKLLPQMPVAVLSRGYKRKTKGYALAGSTTTALDIGDEPMQFYRKFPGLAVAVGEARIEAIPQLLHDRPETKAILLDDAFQHRSVKAGLNILLTDCGNLYTRDWFLPTGDLRDEKSAYKRAGVLVVTKCPPDMPPEAGEAVYRELKPFPHQQVFFTTLKYGTPYHILDGRTFAVDGATEVLLVSGIANPAPLKNYLQEVSEAYYELLYSDHHIFSIDDWKEIIKRFENIAAAKKIIITTEKDAVRLLKFTRELQSYPVYVLPITIEFLFDGEQQFTDIITKFISGFSPITL